MPTRRTFLLSALAPIARPADLGWRAGVARVNITPSESIWLAGYALRDKPSTGVLHDIWAKALALDDGAGNRAVLVTADLLGFTRDMSEVIAARCKERFGLGRAQLLLNASHTHSGPVTGQLLRPAYPLKAEHESVVRRYTGKLNEQVVELAGKALADLAPASLSFGQSLAGFAVNRRRGGQRHLPGVVDHDVPVLTVRAPDGKLRAIVAGYSCHATVLQGNDISGDWPGFAQSDIERLNPGATALFLNGCGADANPLPRSTVELARTYGAVLAAAVQDVVARKPAPLGGRLRTTFDTVDLAFQPALSREEFRKRLDDPNAITRQHARLMLEHLERDGKLADRYPYPVQIWRLGDGLRMVALGGEVVADYSLALKARYGWNDTWVAGYSNDVFAYIPSERVLKEGGYEGGGAMLAYGQPAAFAPGVESTIMKKIEELMQRMN